MIRTGLLLFFALLATAMVAAPVRAKNETGISAPPMQKGGVQSITLIEALAAIDEERLASVFAFIAPNEGPIAFANLLLADHRAAKRFVKFSKKRYEAADAITRWEKTVMLLLVGMNEQRELPMGTKYFSDKMKSKVSELALVPGVTVEEFHVRLLSRGNR